ncbi:MAG: HlyD family efflux transporter periplasmic adaptor subunit [Smithellaceae bacterium]
MKKKIIIIVFVALFVLTGLLVYIGQQKQNGKDLFYSGTIETTQAKLAFQIPGRIAFVSVEEGQAVKKNQVLAALDRAEFEARLAQARAGLARAQKVKLQAEAAYGVMQITLPAEVQRFRAGRQSARDLLADAEKNYRRFETLFQQGAIAEKERDTLRLQYEVAKSRLAESESLLNLAQGNLSRLEAARQDIAAAEAQIDVARAAVQQSEIQLTYSILTSPLDGMVTSRNIEPGETVNAGREVLTISDLSRVDLKIYVEQTQIGRIRPGQSVRISVDTFPDKGFEGTVAFISPEGEFTPKIIQTQKERVKLVYLVKVSVPNPGFELKAGMPADARITE